ncbi:MAG: Uma2 family endonuclease [Deltaproteobacteria bacterium]|nr:Uma2 family endonuclease [Deltaproteobacteria bacterium]
MNGTCTYGDYARLPADGRRWELIDGGLLPLESMRPADNRVRARLMCALASLLPEPGTAVILQAPLGLILDATHVVQPDLVIMAAAHRRLISERGIEGPPDIVVEILSQNRAHDEVLKRGLYEKFGVPEYWIVDARARCVDVLELVEGHYRRRAFLRAEDTLTTPQLDGRVNVPLAPIFAEF